MASAEFLEQVLSTNVDENAVNAIVGSLENQLVTPVSSVSSLNNIVTAGPSQSANITSNSGPIVQSHKVKVDEINARVGVNSVHGNVTSNSSVLYTNVHSLNSTSFTSHSLPGSIPNANETLKVYSQAQPLNSGTLPAQSAGNARYGQVSSQSQLFHAVTGGVLPQQVNKAVNMQPPLVIKQGANSSGHVNMQQGMVTVPMTVSSSMPASIPNVMTLNKPGGQNVIVSTSNMGSAQPTIMPNVQILNMRPGMTTVASQKSVATVSPRVVIGTPQVVGTRATGPITLQSLQSLQPGQQGHLLLKTENGQYQLLRVGHAPAAGAPPAPQPQTIRLSSMPAQSGVATVPGNMAPQGPMPGHLPAAPAAVPVAVSAPVAPPIQQMPTSAPTQIKPSDNTKEKCRNFLANLLDLSSKEPPSVERNVRSLIQELIDAQVEPEQFCDRLEKLLNASPQPCLIGFLKKSLPLLRQSMVTKLLVIEGINPPPAHVAFGNLPAIPPTIVPNAQAMLEDDDCNSSVSLTPLLPPVLPIVLASPSPMPSPPTYVTVSSPSPPLSPQPVPQKPGGSVAVLQNIPLQPGKFKVSSGGSKPMTVNSRASFPRASMAVAGPSTSFAPGKSLLKEKDKRGAAFLQPFGDDKMAGDDDINDVAAMGGVNLAEESQRILGSTDNIGTQIRSCKDEYLVPLHIMQARIRKIAAKHNLEDSPPEVACLLSHAMHERMKSLIEKLAVIAQHRIDTVKNDDRYEPTQDVKGQLKFLEELDRLEKKRREDTEREMLLRAAKSRSKNEDPEQAKLKAKAKEMQRVEMEELRQREANLTALQAIGTRKKPRLELAGAAGDTGSSASGQPGSMAAGRNQMGPRTRIKRVNQRDLWFLLEQERSTAYSVFLYKSYLK